MKVVFELGEGVASEAAIPHNDRLATLRSRLAKAAIMDPTQLGQVLQNLRFGAELSPHVAAKLAPLLSLRDFSAGTVIFDEGADHPWLYLIVAGTVALEMCVPARGCTRILSLGPGDLLAWSSLLGGERMTAAALALTEVRSLLLPAPALRQLCASDYEVGCEIYREVAISLSKRLVATRLQLLDVYGIDAETAGRCIPTP